MEIIKTVEGKIIGDFINSIYEQREEIIKAFIAKYHCEPNEIEQVIQYTGKKIRWYVRKKS